MCVCVLDISSVDLQALGAKEEMCKDRKKWFECCKVGINEVASCRKKNMCEVNRECLEGVFVCLWEKFSTPK